MTAAAIANSTVVRIPMSRHTQASLDQQAGRSPDTLDAMRFEGPSDLHLHSLRSDGTEPPAEVMSAAHRHGVRTAALTDHDTTSGWAEAADAAVSLGMTFLPGMELSARFKWRSVHI